MPTIGSDAAFSPPQVVIRYSRERSGYDQVVDAAARGGWLFLEELSYGCGCTGAAMPALRLRRELLQSLLRRGHKPELRRLYQPRGTVVELYCPQCHLIVSGVVVRYGRVYLFQPLVVTVMARCDGREGGVANHE